MTKDKPIFPRVVADHEHGIRVQTGPSTYLAGSYTAPIFAEKAKDRYIAMHRKAVEKRMAARQAKKEE
jgi:hypothetical protein